MAASYTKGELVRCWGYFDEEGRRVNPDTVTVKIKTPAGVVTSYLYGTDPEVILDDEGVYYVLVSATVAGRWWYRLESTGVGQAAKEAAFDVKAGEFP